MRGETIAMRRRALEKILDTARQLRKPRDGADGPELALATLGQMLSNEKARAWLQESEQRGELDPFLHVLAVWLCAHRSDDVPLLAIVELPRNQARYEQLQAGVLLRRLREARLLALSPPPSLIPDDDEPDEMPVPEPREVQRTIVNGLK